ncbi:hypothetical protein B296_00039995 [Ensete ventricosum]|uniref:Uncharacterized protein n=1 Tax=Ensete ventricosum TaxID=4639 RepID=A0A426ZRR0_ENSVE|nr:hypothetical protein B296_00039995 [Ensete ventricosum]
MLGLRFPRRRSSWELQRSALVSCSLVLLSQFALAMVPRLFPFLSLLAMLPIAGLSPSLLPIRGVLCVCVCVLHICDLSSVAAIPSLLDAILNAECALLLYGLYRYLNFSIIDSFFLFQFTVLTKSADSQRMESIHASSLVISTTLFCILQVLWQVVFLIWHIYCICFNIKTEEWVILKLLFHSALLQKVDFYFMLELGKIKCRSTGRGILNFNLSWSLNQVISHLSLIFISCANYLFSADDQVLLFHLLGSPIVQTRFTNPYDKGFLGNILDFIKSKD